MTDANGRMSNGRRERPTGGSNGRSSSRRVAAAKAVRMAVEQFEELTGKAAEGVSELCRGEDGWVVTVDVVELQRVPSSTDVLGSYEVVLDGDGDLLEYRRVSRWVRGQARE